MSQPMKQRHSSVSRLNAVFTEHPASINESYFEHCRNALRFSGILGMTALAAAVHALVPCLCENTTKRRIAALHYELLCRSASGK